MARMHVGSGGRHGLQGGGRWGHHGRGGGGTRRRCPPSAAQQHLPRLPLEAAASAPPALDLPARPPPPSVRWQRAAHCIPLHSCRPPWLPQIARWCLPAPPPCPHLARLTQPSGTYLGRNTQTRTDPRPLRDCRITGELACMPRMRDGSFAGRAGCAVHRGRPQQLRFVIAGIRNLPDVLEHHRPCAWQSCTHDAHASTECGSSQQACRHRSTRRECRMQDGVPGQSPRPGSRR